MPATRYTGITLAAAMVISSATLLLGGGDTPRLLRASAASTTTTTPDDSTMVAGRVLDESGAPVSGVMVVPTSSRGPAPDPSRDGVVTDELGRFTIFGLAPGSYYFTAIHGHYSPGVSRLFPVAESGWTELDIVLDQEVIDA